MAPIGVTVVLLARNPDPVSTSLVLFGAFVHFREISNVPCRASTQAKIHVRAKR